MDYFIKKASLITQISLKINPINEMDVKTLFETARKNNLAHYIFTLLRVGCLETYKKDPLFELWNKISKKENSIELEQSEDFWILLINLFLVSIGYKYNRLIFEVGEKDFRKKTLEYLKGISKEWSDFIENIFPNKWDLLSEKEKESILIFFSEFINKYKDELKSFVKTQRYFKLKNYEVMELLIDKRGLYGFKIHFSNGSYAKYERNKEGTDSLNLAPGNGGLSMMIGKREDLTNEWKVDGKRLYELGVDGRYNKIGEWKPIVYPPDGDTSKFQKEALELGGENKDVASIIFYMLCTGYRVIEFAVKSKIKFPMESLTFNEGVYLVEVESSSTESEVIYDGWMELKSATPEKIEEGLQTIQKIITGLSFSFDAPVVWCIKYSLYVRDCGLAAPTEKDLKLYDKVLQEMENDKQLVISSAIDWYQKGVASDNIFNAFICYHIAVEGLAMKLANGELEASNFFGFEKKKEKPEDIKKCIDKYYKDFYEKNPKRFLQDAYFECGKPINRLLKKSFVAVFGEKSREYSEYFKDQSNIIKIRSNIVHKSYSDWNFEGKKVIYKKLPILKEIAKKFILRVSLKYKKTRKSPEWSNEFIISLNTKSPNSTLIVSDLKTLPANDWKIKSEWIIR